MQKRFYSVASLVLVLALPLSATAASTLYWSGGTGTWDTTELDWTLNSSQLSPFQAWVNANFDAAVFSGTAGTVTLSQAISAGSLTFNTDDYRIAGNTLTLSGTGSINSTVGTQTISSVLAGSTATIGLTKSGAGTVVLTAANLFRGSTVVAGGGLVVRGSGASIGVASASTSTATIGSAASASLSVENGASVKHTTATLGAASGTTGTVTVDGANSLWNITAASGNTLTIASGGNGALNVTNGGAVTTVRPALFSPTATHTGSLFVDGAGSSFKSTNLTAAGAGTTTVTVSNGGKIEPTGNVSFGGAGTTTVTITSGGQLSPAGSNGVTLGGSTGTTNVTISDGGKVTSTHLSIGAPLAGNVTNVTLTGTGSSWINSNTHAYQMEGTSTLTIADGAVFSPNSGLSVGASAGSIGTLTVGGNGATYNGGSLAGLILGSQGTGTLNVNAGGIVNANHVLRLGNDAASVSTVNQNGGTVTIGRSLEFIAGTLEYHLSGGTLVVGDGIAPGINMNIVTTPQPTSYLFELGGGKLQVKGDSLSELTVIPRLTLKTGTSSTLDTPAGGLQTMYLQGAVVGAGNVVMTGGGTIVVNSTSTYTGTTTVAGGTLLVNGSLANTTLAIAGGATLGGSGTIGGLTTLANGAHLAPGNSPGTLTLTNGLTLESGTILDFQLGTTSDLVRVTGGALTSQSGLILNLSDSGGFHAGTYTLFDFGTGTTDATEFRATDFIVGTSLPGYTYNLAVFDHTLQLTASVSAIPEPSTYAALLGALTLGLAWRRRRTQA